MSNFDIANLVSLLSSSDISKEELITNIRQINFPPPSSADAGTKGEEKEQTRVAIPKNCRTASKQSTSSVKTPSKPSLGSANNSKFASSPRKKPSSKTSKPPLGKVASSRNAKETHDYSKFLKRIEGYQFYKKSQMLRREEQVRSIEMKECRFKPEINAQCCTPRAKIHERLYQQNRDKMERLRVQQQLVKDEFVPSHCTFKPSVNSRKAKARYMAAQATSLKDLGMSSRNFNTCCGSAYSIFSNCPQTPAGEQVCSRNTYQQISQSIEMDVNKRKVCGKKGARVNREVLSSNISQMIPSEEYTTGPISKASSSQCSSHNEKPAASAASKSRPAAVTVNSTGQEEERKSVKGDSKIVFDFDMFKRNLEVNKKTKELLEKFHSDISNYKKIVEPSSVMLSSNSSFIGKI